MRSRIAAIGVVLVLAAGLLSACRSNVGVAARVGSQEISENTVGDYVVESGPRTTTSASTAAGTVAPKPLIVNFLVQDEVYRQALADAGVRPTDAQLDAVLDRAVQSFSQGQSTGAVLKRSLPAQLAQAAIKGSFATNYLRSIELRYLLLTRGRITSATQFAAALRKNPVRVNPRYGKWVVDASQGFAQLSVSGNTPGYLQLQSTASPAASGGA